MCFDHDQFSIAGYYLDRASTTVPHSSSSSAVDMVRLSIETVPRGYRIRWFSFRDPPSLGSRVPPPSIVAVDHPVHPRRLHSLPSPRSLTCLCSSRSASRLSLAHALSSCTLFLSPTLSSDAISRRPSVQGPLNTLSLALLPLSLSLCTRYTRLKRIRIC